MANESAEDKAARLARERDEAAARIRAQEEARIKAREEADLEEARAAAAGTAPATESQKTIHVVSTLPARDDGGSQVALFEIDAAHPGGQAYVAGPVPVEVSPTAEVSRAIHEGRMREVPQSEASSLRSKYEDDRAKARDDARAASAGETSQLAREVVDEAERRSRR